VHLMAILLMLCNVFFMFVLEILNSPRSFEMDGIWVVLSYTPVVINISN